LIAQVVTITPLPLLYHVCTFYIARYTSSTTHPSQPTYTFDELQKRKRKRNKGETIKKRNKNKAKQNNTVIIIIIMIIIPIHKCTTDIP